jgi:hypothetical protein
LNVIAGDRAIKGPARRSAPAQDVTMVTASACSALLSWQRSRQLIPEGALDVMSASDVIAKFETKSGGGAWKHITRAEVTKGLRDRVANPGKIDTSSCNLCGPASFLYSVLIEYPEDYCKYIIDLYEGGKGKLWGLEVEPDDDAMNYDVPKSKMHPVDWIGLGSLRDAENDFFDYQSIDDAASAITMPHTLTSWFEEAEYPTRHNVTNLVFTKSKSDIVKANDLRLQGCKVCLFIDADMLEASTQDSTSTTPDHWVVLTGPVTFSGDNISLEVFTWGEAKRKVPRSGSLPLSSFLKHFYGYVAAK